MSALQKKPPIRVMIVDDSAVVRGLLTRMIEASNDIAVVASVGNGKMAVENLMKNEVEVVVLDIEMPVLDGLSALPQLIAQDNAVRIIMASTLTSRNADISLRALQAGAVDYIPKPSSSREMSGGQAFSEELITKIRTHGEARRKVKGLPTSEISLTRPARLATNTAPKKVELRKATLKGKPEVIAIGSSTGGPQALFSVLKGLYGKTTLPIVITQHMPATFTKILSEHINRMTGWKCQEATDGLTVEAGNVYLAPGDYHMVVESVGLQKILRLNQDPPENFCRPAVDPMFRSVAKAYNGKVMAIILTGMGSDGLKGSRVVIDHGGDLIGQDEETSVVWGMPGAVAQGGLCSAVLPIQEIPLYIIKAASGGLS